MTKNFMRIFVFFLCIKLFGGTPVIDAILLKKEKVFVRISLEKNSAEYENIKKHIDDKNWDMQIMEAEGKELVVFSITGKNKRPEELEKYLFFLGFEKVRYNGKELHVSELEENYVSPESPEVINFKRN
jgi:hypothetical protein